MRSDADVCKDDFRPRTRHKAENFNPEQLWENSAEFKKIFFRNPHWAHLNDSGTNSENVSIRNRPSVSATALAISVETCVRRFLTAVVCRTKFVHGSMFRD